jgi:hypothetical protein
MSVVTSLLALILSVSVASLLTVSFNITNTDPVSQHALVLLFVTGIAFVFLTFSTITDLWRD